ncbi:MAG: AtpZ/AtpI family protein [Pyrinomonadaceae bacterium]
MIKGILDNDEDVTSKASARKSAVPSLFDENSQPPDEPFILSEGEPTTLAESIRQGGLAYSAGIVLFASVLFMLLIGWGADILFGSSPWGIVVGIAIGALIGFFQFFRITSQIFKK